MRKGKLFPMVRPTGLSKGLPYSDQIPKACALDYRLSWNGTLYTGTSDYEVFSWTQGFSTVTWGGGMPVFTPFFRWRAVWDLAESTTNMFLTIVVEDLLGGFFSQTDEILNGGGGWVLSAQPPAINSVYSESGMFTNGPSWLRQLLPAKPYP